MLSVGILLHTGAQFHSLTAVAWPLVPGQEKNGRVATTVSYPAIRKILVLSGYLTGVAILDEVAPYSCWLIRSNDKGKTVRVAMNANGETRGIMINTFIDFALRRISLRSWENQLLIKG